MSVELALMAERSTSEHFSREPVFLKFVGCLTRLAIVRSRVRFPPAFGIFYPLFYLPFLSEFSFIIKSWSFLNKVPQKDVHLYEMTRKAKKKPVLGATG